MIKTFSYRIFFLVLALIFLMPGCYEGSSASLKDEDLNNDSTAQSSLKVDTIIEEPVDPDLGFSDFKQDDFEDRNAKNKVGEENAIETSVNSYTEDNSSQSEDSDFASIGLNSSNENQKNLVSSDVDGDKNLSTNIQKKNTLPELELKVIAGPEYAQDNQVCYFRVRAIVGGNPMPEISFNKDDSNGLWGKDIAQVNLIEDQSFTLICRAENIEGSIESSIVVNWIDFSDAIIDSTVRQEETTNDSSGKSINSEIDNYFIDVDLSLQQVEVYYKDELIRSMLCSAGKPETPTPLGEYRTYQKIYYQYIPKFSQGAYYWTRFYQSYLFHSVPTDKDKNFLVEEYEKLGQPASHGCIRLKVEDAKWIYDNLPLGVLVKIHY